ncbi:unnamed protein product [Microthlaspi erraticum]|uniref:F-box domain-containing protein n=1 Tax=Microthlaspi erraticum TaxID=1685480 RepID=A0A6D2IDM4_9BRAS|nr:unnamed protein product [Microthlaspi erraticum]
MAMRSRKSPRWENMDRDILAKIFEKLNVIDVTMGASRVCISWFLVCHQKSLWKTIDLAYLQLDDFNHPRLKNFLVDVTIEVDTPPQKYDIYHPRKILNEITKFSSTVPSSLFLNFRSWVEDEDLIIAAERMPNITKFVLPRWGNLSEDSYRFVFSQWKNLHTLIISPAFYVNQKILKFQLVAENCINLTNLKISGYVDEDLVVELVRYLPNLKRLSMRGCKIYHIKKVSFHIIRCLQNLASLNLSHCIFNDKITGPICGIVLEDSLIENFTQKIDTFIMCSKVGCLLCEDPYKTSIDVYEKHWRNDEIKELEF